MHTYLIPPRPCRNPRMYAIINIIIIITIIIIIIIIIDIIIIIVIIIIIITYGITCALQLLLS